jgi:hypothetical protein
MLLLVMMSEVVMHVVMAAGMAEVVHAAARAKHAEDAGAVDVPTPTATAAPTGHRTG